MHCLQWKVLYGGCLIETARTFQREIPIPRSKRNIKPENQIFAKMKIKKNPDNCEITSNVRYKKVLRKKIENHCKIHSK